MEATCGGSSMSREAMELALEALESDPITHAGLVSRKQAITALRQALVDADDTLQKRVDVKAKDRHEPVAWASSLDFDDDAQEIIPAKDKGKLGTSNWLAAFAEELRQVMQENEELRQGLARMAALYEKAANDRDALFEKYVASAIRARGNK